MSKRSDNVHENATWWHRHWTRKRTANASLVDTSYNGSSHSSLSRSASHQERNHKFTSSADCSTSSNLQTDDGQLVVYHQIPRSVGSSPLSTSRRMRVFGCASALPTVDSEYQLAEPPAEATPATKPVKKQKLWRNIKFTTSVIRLGGKTEATDDNLSTSAPELCRTSKQKNNESQKESSTDDKKVAKVDEYVTFHVKIRLKDGKNLVVRDASGSSDPYVKFKYKSRTYFKSNTIYKNLNPVWEEEFSQLIDDPTTPIAVDVYDYDRFAADDYMGGGLIDVSQLRLFQLVLRSIMKVTLLEEGKTDEMGEVNLVVTVTPLTQTEKEQFMKKCVRGITSEQLKRPQKTSQVWLSVVNIVLIEGRNLMSPTNIALAPDPLVKFKLGSEKYKSKPASRTRNPKWLEQFDLHLYDEPTHMLEMMVNDKRNSECMGRCSIDLDKLEKECANQLLCELENGNGSIQLLVSISGTTSTDAVVDLCEFTGNDVRNAIVSKYVRILKNLTTFSKDTFIAEFITNTPMYSRRWIPHNQRSVKDIHSVLEITVYDEDPNKKAGFLGKIAIPLLKIENCEKRWYALKNRKLDQASKGQIELELDVIWNPIRAAIRTFNPREEKYMQSEPKFKRQVFMHNYARLKNSLLCAMEIHDFVQSCFNWDSPKRSIIAFMVYLVSVYFFELYHVPLIILALFLKTYLYQYYNPSVTDMSQREASPRESYEDDETTEQSERGSSTLKDRLYAIQDTLAMVQNTMDFIASLLERVKNTFNFTQQYLSNLAIVVLIIATILLYVVPLRWILIVWGINKFTKKLRNPNFIPNNELLDFLSRVPSDAEIVSYKHCNTVKYDLCSLVPINDNFQRAYEELKIDEKITTQSSVENSTVQRTTSR
ncbi:unnamed protein product [Anisakis simplex]|uniref:Multiple C2 and transmembrane domain-containing protein 1 n=1 Tax=Anisakis simplex TaxID=6269 RepID=A0A158PNE6_ANISI|nr:unnamed protein product [Anisakis simplex]